MEILGGIIKGPLHVDRDLEVLGRVAGDVTVQTGCRLLLLRGVVTGDVIIKAGARATLDGRVFGTVFNHGGRVEIRGTVGAVVDTSQAAQTLLAYDAVITSLRA
ncbi:hypothetical protein [Caballeronia concitans]|jgi:cytoskeletal protein CcmA (bactofilin family)|uniref:Polymer-forming cytoskeletal n=1 Tax=Caballeronia concitans TaxID=1777133 RepID=A0A658R5G8_9BURK|nr:hypothetical protein [Caballeronia concitans]SAL52687.1 hypothetical protein AWB72_05627 [Caballeronia concitans]